jgi:hypothetical protein
MIVFLKGANRTDSLIFLLHLHLLCLPTTVELASILQTLLSALMRTGVAEGKYTSHLFYPNYAHPKRAQRSHCVSVSKSYQRALAKTRSFAKEIPSKQM